MNKAKEELKMEMTIDERAIVLYRAHVCRRCGYIAQAEALEAEVREADEAKRKRLDKQAGLEG
jgi:hypothetical protein